MVVNPSHEDFPRLLCEAIDFITAAQFDAAAAAGRLGVSTSQLVKLLKLSPAALESVNRERATRSLRKLN